ncbi:Nif3-like dinuclear metal center hexameric protein [Pleomorphovibrio marinus]|uniref:Nif3-like dinuclear metal center hexameric protein n=1 Tax=Pleomorphovibrio marinus TaxID=2164132 RepID=UPI000E0B7267|nr:Nif3-like dinuclear metal center hexameric protein [Pleomorphovibrio marinus]
MAYLLRELIAHLETIAPPAYQESYDNAQLLVGDPAMEVRGVLCSLDATEEVVKEAKENNCNVIVAHHPIIFKGLKSLTGKNYVERTVIKAIKEEVAIYAIHTNLDHVAHGVNAKIAQKLGLEKTGILAPKLQLMMKLVTFVPLGDTQAVLNSLYRAGAGVIGEYSGCSFRVGGTGTFQPSDKANPTIGKHDKPEEVEENRIEIMFPAYLKQKVVSALKQAHPYEEVAYYLHELENENQEVGAGMVGFLPTEMEALEFLKFLKQKMNLSSIKYTQLIDRPIRKVALCGGAGFFLLNAAKARGADIFITSDIKYHEFFDADGEIVLADIGHYESEFFTKELLLEILSKKFPNIALYLSKVITNPVSYL